MLLGVDGWGIPCVWILLHEICKKSVAGILGFLRDFFIHPSIDDTHSLGKHGGKNHPF